MPDSTGPPGDNELADAVRSAEKEAERVGLNWSVLERVLLRQANYRGTLAQLEESDDALIGLDINVLLATLRDLPDDAGTDAVLAAMGIPRTPDA